MYYSQFGEDRLLKRIFLNKSHGVCVEVGANNGVDGSTTLHFEQMGWNCILVEPNPILCKELRRRRSAQVFECAASSATGMATLHVAVGPEQAHAVSALGGDQTPAQILKEHGFRSEPVEVLARRLDDILEDANFAGDLDFISIDVEGHELELLKGFSLDRWRPTILIVEDNSPWSESSVSDYLRSHGYIRFWRTGVNDWYASASNESLASAARRIGYLPSMLYGRALMSTLKLLAPALPSLRRVPGALLLRDFLFGRKRDA